tara:strand:+ start:4096 stop:4455 length:360 start_codon:yes stop_codon:yes gene_type:complete
MICLNSKGLPLLEELKNLRAITMEDMDTIDKIRKLRADRAERLRETISEHNPEAMFADGFDESIMGYSSDGKVIYSADQIIGTLMNRDGMTQEEATEYFNFNIECAFVGEFTPIYMYEE